MKNSELAVNNPDQVPNLSIAVVGSGGAGALTTGNMLLAAAAKQGCYGILTRAVGPQIRGGEAASMVHLSAIPVDCVSDEYDILLAMDWNNVHRFADEIAVGPNTLIISDPKQGEVPEAFARSHPQVQELPIGALAKQVKKGRANMIALGALAEVIGLTPESIEAVVRKQLAKKGEQILQTSMETLEVGQQAAGGFSKRSLPVSKANGVDNWIITGNQAAGLGALRAGVRFVAAYPITPATEILEWMSSALAKVGGTLVQAEDELASINMLLGASYGGVPALTATSGPGLALMTESLGLAVSAEVPVVVVDVMRGGPSTGIPTTAEQSDLNLAVYGLHGDAPHLVLAPTSIVDCVLTTQWSVCLAEALQTPAIVLSDQYLGQTRSIVNSPEVLPMYAERETVSQPEGSYERYAVTDSGVSPMAIPGTPGGQHTATGLEHTPVGSPSSTAHDHAKQLDKRARKIAEYDYGDKWAEYEGEGDHAVITWGSTTGAVRQALKQLRSDGVDNIRMLAIRLLLPAQVEKFADALSGVKKILVVEQSHSAQYRRYLSAHYALPAQVEVFHRAGPSQIRAVELVEKIKSWSEA